MFQHLFVPLDGSPGAERAIPLAARLARSVGGSITFLHMIPPLTVGESTTGHLPATAQMVERETQALLEAAAYLGSVPATYAAELAGVSTELEVACGLTPSLLASTTSSDHGDLVVMGSHREAGLERWGQASSAWLAIHRQIGALLIVKEQGRELQPDQAHPLRVVVPLDGSLFAETALEPAARLLAQLSCFGELPSEMHLVYVVAEHGAAYEKAERYLQTTRERLRRQRILSEYCLVTSAVIVGNDVAEVLLEQVHAIGGSPCIAMATHGREGVPRLMWGNITERVLDTVTGPLLIVHPVGAIHQSLPSRLVASSER